MAQIELILDVKDNAWLIANPNYVLKNDEPLFVNDGRIAFGDGTTPVSGLSFFQFGGGSYEVETPSYVLNHPGLVLADKKLLLLRDGRYTIGDGVTPLSGLLFYSPASSGYITAGVLPETTTFMNAIGIPNTAATYYSGTSQQITGAQFWVAINGMFNALKTNGLWSNGKGVALYPLIGGTAFSHKFNAFSPYDTDPDFRLTYQNAPLHDQLGITFTGNNYADTHIIPVGDGFDLSTGMCVAFCSTTNSVNPEYVMGSYPNSYYATDSSGLYLGLGCSYNLSSPAPNIQGCHIINRQPGVSNSFRYLRNGTIQLTALKSFLNFGATEVLLGAVDDMGTYYYAANGVNLSFVGIFYGLTAAEEMILNSIMVQFQTDLNR